MARVRIPHTVVKPDPANANALIPASGASVEVRVRSTNALASVYGGETGGSPISNPVATDAAGRVAAWVERGAYNLVVSGSGVTGYTMPWEASPASDQAVDVAWLANTALPIGGVMAYGGTADVGGWLLCDGRAISRTTYAALFGVMSTAYGVGDGSTTFNLPDLRGRAPIGVGTGSGLSARARGAAVGEENHVLTTPEIPAHTHSYIETSVPFSVGAGGGSAYGTVGATTGSTGGGGGHNTMQPSLALNFIIRAL